MTYRVPVNPKVIKRSKLFTKTWPEPTPADVRAVWKVMCARYGATLVDKNSSTDMQVLANALDAMGIVDKQRFMNDYVTTVGTKIYTPFTPGVEVAPWDLWQQVMVAGHECHHIYEAQQQEGVLYNFTYATNSTMRAYYEMEAYRVQMVLDWHFRGQVWDPAAIAAMLKDYNCDASDIAMVTKMLQLSLISVKKGADPSPVCQFETKFLEALWSR